MVSKRMLIIANISLAILALILLLNFFGVRYFSLGNALYQLDPSTPYCVTNYQNQYSLLPDLNVCCSGVQQQLFKAESFTKPIYVNGQLIPVQEKYYTADSTISYFINTKTQRYCKNNGFLV